MGLELTKQPGPLGKVGKQGLVVPCQPAIKSAVADPFEGVQHPQGDHFAGPQRGLGMFGQGLHPIIDPAKQVCDQVDAGHDRSPLMVSLERTCKLTWGRLWPLQFSLKN